MSSDGKEDRKVLGDYARALAAVGEAPPSKRSEALHDLELNTMGFLELSKKANDVMDRAIEDRDDSAIVAFKEAFEATRARLRAEHDAKNAPVAPPAPAAAPLPVLPKAAPVLQPIQPIPQAPAFVPPVASPMPARPPRIIRGTPAKEEEEPTATRELPVRALLDSEPATMVAEPKMDDADTEVPHPGDDEAVTRVAAAPEPAKPKPKEPRRVGDELGRGTIRMSPPTFPAKSDAKPPPEPKKLPPEPKKVVRGGDTLLRPPDAAPLVPPQRSAQPMPRAPGSSPGLPAQRPSPPASPPQARPALRGSTPGMPAQQPPAARPKPDDLDSTTTELSRDKFNIPAAADDDGLPARERFQEPRLTLMQYAAMRAEVLSSTDATRASVYARYRLSEAEDAAEAAAWNARFSADRALFNQYMQVFNYFRGLARR